MRTKGSKGVAILLISKKDNSIIKKFDSIRIASEKTGVSPATISSQAISRGGTRNPDKCFVYERDYREGLRVDIKTKQNRKVKHNRVYGKSVLMLDKQTNKVLAKYSSTGVAGKATGIPSSTISCQCIDKTKGRRDDVYFMYEEDYQNLGKEIGIDIEQDNKENEDSIYFEEHKEEIIRRKIKEYYVNVLVGLANATLEDGAIYKINGNDLVYSKENEALMLGDNKMFTRLGMYEEIEIELPLLSESERTFLKNLLKAFNNVKGIRKCNDIRNGFEFIRIETIVPSENTDLPAFVENKYYSNLMLDRLYSVDELGI